MRFDSDKMRFAEVYTPWRAPLLGSFGALLASLSAAIFTLECFICSFKADTRSDNPSPAPNPPSSRGSCRRVPLGGSLRHRISTCIAQSCICKAHKIPNNTSQCPLPPPFLPQSPQTPLRPMATDDIHTPFAGGAPADERPPRNIYMHKMSREPSGNVTGVFLGGHFDEVLPSAPSLDE